MQICKVTELDGFKYITKIIRWRTTGNLSEFFNYQDENKAARETTKSDSLTPGRICTVSSHFEQAMPLRYTVYGFIQHFPIFLPKVCFKHMLLCVLTRLLKSFWLLPLFLFKCLNYIFSLNKSQGGKKLQAPKGNITFQLLFCFFFFSIWQTQKVKIETFLRVVTLDRLNKEN